MARSVVAEAHARVMSSSRTGRPVYAQSVLTCSAASSARYDANVAANGTSPVDAMPAAIGDHVLLGDADVEEPVRVARAKSTVRLAKARSAVSTTIRGSASARSASTSPATNAGNGLRLDALAGALVLRRSRPAVPRKTSLICCLTRCRQPSAPPRPAAAGPSRSRRSHRRSLRRRGCRHATGCRPPSGVRRGP